MCICVCVYRHVCICVYRYVCICVYSAFIIDLVSILLLYQYIHSIHTYMQYHLHTIIYNHIPNNLVSSRASASLPNTLTYMPINYYILLALSSNCLITSYLCASSMCQ